MNRSRLQGSLVGLAVGDALGYPAEFRTRRQLQQELGPEGVTGFIRLKDPRFTRPFIIGPDHPPGTFTDDTQMSLCVAEGLLAAGRAGRDTLMQELARRFVQWHRSEDNNRAPGETTGIACGRLASGVPWQGWVAEEAVACALYCFWRHPDDYRAAVLEAVNTDGDSDSLATIAGSLSGARVGLEGIPSEWVAGVEQSARLLQLGNLLADTRLRHR